MTHQIQSAVRHPVLVKFYIMLTNIRFVSKIVHVCDQILEALVLFLHASDIDTESMKANSSRKNHLVNGSLLQLVMIRSNAFKGRFKRRFKHRRILNDKAMLKTFYLRFKGILRSIRVIILFRVLKKCFYNILLKNKPRTNNNREQAPEIERIFLVKGHERDQS